ncbi:nucleotidyltransferase domain-containing protein [Paenibacillus senegalensis]|uniref:nucleotidyltransferase domain-containing protein n=1 Tax=Paenibacillus senegalensis TaxID=1465766 RepID=UPI000287A452|nr:nucleotidyltransferase domain-containing protein [Paenibacillus senegalensis]
MSLHVQKLVSDYFNGPLKQQSAYPFVLDAWSTALIVVTGSYSFGMFNEASDLDLEFILPDEQHSALVEKAGGVQNLWVHDKKHQPLVDIKFRPRSWLQKRLNGNDPEVLWIYRHAVIIQDSRHELPQLLDNANKQFYLTFFDLITRAYKDLRAGITLSAAREPLGKTIMMNRAIDAALSLPFLVRQAPYPYPKWKSIWLKDTHEKGSVIVSLCEQWLTGSPVYESLRVEINSVLVESGYQDLTRHFWRKA